MTPIGSDRTHFIEGGEAVFSLDQLVARGLIWQLEFAAHHLKLRIA